MPFTAQKGHIAEPEFKGGQAQKMIPRHLVMTVIQSDRPEMTVRHTFPPEHALFSQNVGRGRNSVVPSDDSRYSSSIWRWGGGTEALRWGFANKWRWSSAFRGAAFLLLAVKLSSLKSSISMMNYSL